MTETTERTHTYNKYKKILGDDKCSEEDACEVLSSMECSKCSLSIQAFRVIFREVYLVRGQTPS